MGEHLNDVIEQHEEENNNFYESIFDLQTDLINLLNKHNLAETSFAFIYKDQSLSIINLDQQGIEEAATKKAEQIKNEQNNSQKED